VTAIRPYEDRDLDTCRELWRDLTQAHREIYDDPTIGGEDPGIYFDRHLADPRLVGLWVAECESAPAGLVGLLMKDGEAEIEPLVVARGYRFRGVGRALLEFIVEEARTRGARHLSVRPVARNTEAIRCFHSAGFRLLGHIEMFLELVPSTRATWKPGIAMHGRRFRY
jgi:GNAT superfamily N-acetyltransferase